METTYRTFGSTVAKGHLINLHQTTRKPEYSKWLRYLPCNTKICGNSVKQPTVSKEKKEETSEFNTNENNMIIIGIATVEKLFNFHGKMQEREEKFAVNRKKV